jgi:hypothetical protein
MSYEKDFDMARTPRTRLPVAGEVEFPFEFSSPSEVDTALRPYTHRIRAGVICRTDTKGYASPNEKSPAEIVVDASEGSIPLWEAGVTLRWRFQQQSLAFFKDRDAIEDSVSNLLGEALLLWGDAVPVKFVYDEGSWDFEMVVSPTKDCTSDNRSCVLAKAFFPDAGRHELIIYPTMFQQVHQEQIETLAHELGHIFGLRHFFAQISEAKWRSEIFGVHQPFSIMNYGEDSFMTDNDRSDLRRLYELVWSGQLKSINGTPIRLVRPYSAGAATASYRVQSAAVESAQGGPYCCCCGRPMR